MGQYWFAVMQSRGGCSITKSGGGGGAEGGSRNCRFYRFRQFTVKDRCFPRFVLKVRKIFNWIWAKVKVIGRHREGPLLSRHPASGRGLWLQRDCPFHVLRLWVLLQFRIIRLINCHFGKLIKSRSSGYYWLVVNRVAVKRLKIGHWKVRRVTDSVI